MRTRNWQQNIVKIARTGQGEKAEWRNSGMDITINQHAHCHYCFHWPCGWFHVHGNLCLARARAWKFMACKGVATIETTEATATVKVSALA